MIGVYPEYQRHGVARALEVEDLAQDGLSRRLEKEGSL